MKDVELWRLWSRLGALLDGPLGEDECEEAIEALGRLLAWVDRGGFVPAGWGLGRTALMRTLQALLVRLGDDRERLVAARRMSGASYQFN